MPSFSSYFNMCPVSPIPRARGTVWSDPRTRRFWRVHQADAQGRPDRRLEDKLHCWGCGPERRFKYITTTTRVDRLRHGARCAARSKVFWGNLRYLEDSADRLIFRPRPTPHKKKDGFGSCEPFICKK